ncbi:hypothetical protein EHQ52_09520 [Leptospira koniambonensis]|uniref:Uncharacterized protein n=1 Tax=Leptospira koniambonensis TaxID=2484950 RepID=A0A4R9J9Y6_9LEPT|nr:hypothetical protein [Leptospira koniambonensis]TGL34724.1 hypothetical protein EHQ52_09520 [Leptospira koniambonensis]
MNKDLISFYVLGCIRSFVFLIVLCIMLVVSESLSSYLYDKNELPEISFISGLVLSIGAAFTASREKSQENKPSKLVFILVSSLFNFAVLLVGLFLIRKFFPGWIA